MVDDRFYGCVTAHPTAEWIANQITEACGWEQAPRYLIRDLDGAYGEIFIRRLRSMGIRDRPTSPRSPWQNGYAERLIGSIRRECVDHVVIFGERHLRHVLLSYMKYYNEARTHLSLNKDAPMSRAAETAGRIICDPILGGRVLPTFAHCPHASSEGALTHFLRLTIGASEVGCMVSRDGEWDPKSEFSGIAKL